MRDIPVERFRALQTDNVRDDRTSSGGHRLRNSGGSPRVGKNIATCGQGAQAWRAVCHRSAAERGLLVVAQLAPNPCFVPPKCPQDKLFGWVGQQSAPAVKQKACRAVTSGVNIAFAYRHLLGVSSMSTACAVVLHTLLPCMQPTLSLEHWEPPRGRANLRLAFGFAPARGHNSASMHTRYPQSWFVAIVLLLLVLFLLIPLVSV